MTTGASYDEGGDSAKASAFVPLFAQITPKQHEVFQLVAQNRTSKEIAGRLGISESAVNQRIEAVRARAGFPPRAELARAYRQFLAAQAAIAMGAVEENGGANNIPRRDSGDWIVPPSLTGPAARLNRAAAMVIIAAGMLVVFLLGLGVAEALHDLV